MAYDFVKVDIDELDELSDFASDIWHEYWKDMLSSGQIDYMVEKFQSKSAISNQIKYENYTYFYIVSDNKKAGYFALSKEKDYLFLSKIYLKKYFRHKGLGTNAFEFIKDFAKKSGYEKIVLTVNKHNKNSISAYQKWGFKIKEAVVTDIGEGYVMDDYIMEWCTSESVRRI